MSTPAATTRGRRGPWRWAVALVATVLLVVSGSGLVVFAQSGAAESKGPQFVPADATIYVEARLDMPGGQAEAVAQLMTAFPGFADASSFGMKTDDLVNGLVEQATGGAMTFSGELEEALTGEIGLAMLDVAAAAMGGEDEPPVLVGVAIDDAEAAQSFVDMMLAGASMDEDTTEEAYGNASIVSDGSTAVALHDEWFLLSQDVETLKAGIDALEGTTPSLADDADFSAAFSRVPSGRLGAAYVDLGSFAGLLDLASMMAEGETGMALPLPIEDLAAMLPKDMVAYLAAESDRLTLEAFITPGESTPTVPFGDSELAGFYPADTQVYVETRELGAAIESALNGLADLLASMPVDEDSMGAGGVSDIGALFGEESPITSVLGEPLPTFLDFVSDASIGGGLTTSDGLWLGIAAEVTDQAKADKRIARITSMIRLFGEESGIDIKPTTIGDATATVITLPEEMIGAATGDSLPIPNTITISVAGDHLLIGLGDFVENALTQASVDSLGASAGYTDALAGDVPNSGVLYANIGAILSELDPMLSFMVEDWEDIAPYATAFDRLIAVGTADDEVISSRMTVIVNQ